MISVARRHQIGRRLRSDSTSRLQLRTSVLHGSQKKLFVHPCSTFCRAERAEFANRNRIDFQFARAKSQEIQRWARSSLGFGGVKSPLPAVEISNFQSQCFVLKTGTRNCRDFRPGVETRNRKNHGFLALRNGDASSPADRSFPETLGSPANRYGHRGRATNHILAIAAWGSWIAVADRRGSRDHGALWVAQRPRASEVMVA